MKYIDCRLLTGGACDLLYLSGLDIIPPHCVLVSPAPVWPPAGLAAVGGAAAAYPGSPAAAAVRPSREREGSGLKFFKTNLGI